MCVCVYTACISVRIPRVCVCVCVYALCVCVCACLWTHRLLPAGAAGAQARGHRARGTTAPAVLSCPSVPFFLAPEEAEKLFLPPWGSVKAQTTGLCGPPPRSPKRTVHPPCPRLSCHPPARPVIRHRFTEQHLGTKTVLGVR